MSYSDKEKHMDYQSDDVESSAEKFNNPSNHSTVGNEKVDDILPVGQLKWRRDEEEEQDTLDSLEDARKFEPAKQEGDKEKKEEQTEEKKDSGNQFHSHEPGNGRRGMPPLHDAAQKIYPVFRAEGFPRHHTPLPFHGLVSVGRSEDEARQIRVAGEVAHMLLHISRIDDNLASGAIGSGKADLVQHPLHDRMQPPRADILHRPVDLGGDPGDGVPDLSDVDRDQPTGQT